MIAFHEQRRRLVDVRLKGRGISDPKVLEAVRSVPREAFLPPELVEFAYRDTALPIQQGQTISQPYIVALMAQALELSPEDRVLEVGTGSGYAAAVLARMAREVYTIERHEELAELAAHRLKDQGFENVTLLHGDGSLGWPEHAPFDAICVAACGPDVPQPLLQQLAVGGRMVIPVGDQDDVQKLVRVRRTGEAEYHREELGDVRFVPLIGAGAWRSVDGVSPSAFSSQHPVSRPSTIAELIRENAEPFQEIREADFGALTERIGDSRMVLIGEATHGTSEFYRIRAEITKQLITKRGFRIVALEADWPDAARIDRYVRDVHTANGQDWEAFSRFPTWMWRNHEVVQFIEWLREYNLAIDDPTERVAIYGLDLYSLFTSIRAVLDYLDKVDPVSARTARVRYGCLTPWEGDPALYGRMAIGGRYRVCEKEAVAALTDLLKQRLDYTERDGAKFLDAVQNARLIADAERYYRVMYYGANESWNLRDQHMFDTLELVLAHHGSGAKGVVWEHNSHLGDAACTDMGSGGQINVGHLCRQRFGSGAYLIGQGTHHGTVAAASDWDEPIEVMQVRPAFPESYERLCHDSRVGAFFLPLRDPRMPEVREELGAQRFERAIGVVYRPQTEMQSHYFLARLADQFDEWIWFDRTQAVRPVTAAESARFSPDHPFHSRQ